MTVGTVVDHAMQNLKKVPASICEMPESPSVDAGRRAVSCQKTSVGRPSITNAPVFSGLFFTNAQLKNEKRLNINTMCGSAAERATTHVSRSMSALSARLSDRHRSLLNAIQSASG